MRFNPWLLLCCWMPSAGAVDLLLNPDTCIVTQVDKPCMLELRVAFDEPLSQPACLFLEPQINALYCLKGQGELAIHQLFSLELDTRRFLELRAQTGELLARKPLHYAVYQPAKTRRRRGLGWNLL